MRERMKVLGTLGLVVLLVIGLCAVLSPDSAMAKKPQPPPCPCPDPLVLPDGTVCELEACGFDCVYSCPFPF